MCVALHFSVVCPSADTPNRSIWESLCRSAGCIIWRGSAKIILNRRDSDSLVRLRPCRSHAIQGILYVILSHTCIIVWKWKTLTNNQFLMMVTVIVFWCLCVPVYDSKSTGLSLLFLLVSCHCSAPLCACTFGIIRRIIIQCCWRQQRSTMFDDDDNSCIVMQWLHGSRRI